MDTQHNMEDRLWEYIDGTASATERSFIDQLVATNQAWKAKYQELLEVHQLMQNHLELDEPSMRFTQNVMESIAREQITPAAQSYINKRVIRGIAAFFFLTMLCFLIYAIGQVNWSSGSSGALSVDFSKVNTGIDKLLSNSYTNIFLMVNTVLGLIVLDMYLGRKKKQLREKQS